MDENTSAVECLVLFYINTKHVLKTKQLDERVFLDQMIRYCKASGFDTYSDEEIRNTWKSLISKYVELKKIGTVSQKESWKYYEIFDSCYEQSDFHNGVYPKFSEEMVWFLIECFLKRKGLEKTQKKNGILHEIHKDFLQSGYLYITKQDIENKWKYLNLKYDKLKDDANNFNNVPYLQALKGYREKDKGLVKMIFTKELTEILIERFTEKKITCVVHGYNSEQVLSEIQSEFRDLGFDFSQEEIRDKWKKLTNIYTFLKTKGKHDSSWIYFNAMKYHFKDDFLFGANKVDIEAKDNIPIKLPRRQRSKSVGADARLKYNTEIGKTKLVVNIEQLNKEKLLHSSPEKPSEGKRKRVTKRKPSSKVTAETSVAELHTSSKKLKLKSKSREKLKTNRNRNADNNRRKVRTKSSESLTPTINSIQVKKNKKLTKFSIDRNVSHERKGSMDIGSPGSKVHIINIDESKIDKKSGNLTINLPSITKQFSDNEFLPLKKRQRVSEGNAGRHSDEPKDIEDGFRGFPREEDESQTRLKSNESENQRLTKEEMMQVIESINEDKYEGCGIASNVCADNQSYCKPEQFNCNYQDSYGKFDQSCLLIPKEELQENLPLQNYNRNTITPPPVLLLVIKVDGSNNPAKDSPEDKKQPENKGNGSPQKNERKRSSSNSKSAQKNESCSTDFVKSVSPENKNCTVTEGEHIVSGDPKTNEVNNLQSKTFNNDLNKGASSKTEKLTMIQNENIVTIQNSEAKRNDGVSIQVKHNNLIALNGANHKSPPTAQSEDKEVIVRISEAKNEQQNEKENKAGEATNTNVEVTIQTMPSPEKSIEITDTLGIVSPTTPEKNIMMPPTLQQSNTPKKIRLPVKGGGNVKEIFISPRELSKLTTVRNGGLRANISPTKPINDESLIKPKLDVKTTPYKPPPKFKYISQVIKGPKAEFSLDNKPENIVPDVKNKFTTSTEPAADTTLLESATVPMGTKFVGTNASAVSSKNLKNEEFENESVFSEAVGDDDGLKDNLLATVIDFQEQNNQEFIEIKNLMKQNNLLQRETNRLLRLMLEKM